MTPRVIAVDWSGDARSARNKIWLAEVDAAGSVVRLECGRDRGELADHLIHEAALDPELIVGLDFAFSLPEWFLQERGHSNAYSLWDAVKQYGEEWLASCQPPFWGRPGATRPKLRSHLRRTDEDIPAVGGTRPKSVFQIGGAGTVGTGSLRGMPELKRLRDAGFSIWPFDTAGLPLVVEIYPRILTGAVVKTIAADRDAYLQSRFPALPDEVRTRAADSDDAFDALVSALVMKEHMAELIALPAAQDGTTLLEGRIWMPTTTAVIAPKPARRLRDSTKTRVGPVFTEIVNRSKGEPWVRRLLDLASFGNCDPAEWRSADLSVLAQHWDDTEQCLEPPIALLSWLIRNFTPSKPVAGSDVTATKRKALAARDPDVVLEGLRLVRQRRGDKGWHILEGPTCPDVLLTAADALIVIEGKRTEAGATVDTTWMPGRHQMLRHIDAAWEARGNRRVFGMFIVEGEGSAPMNVPKKWADASRLTFSPECLRSSLPHRGPEEQAAIAHAFVGVATWEQVRVAFRLPMSVLPSTVHDIVK